jgi:hypothetical protein
LERLLITTAGVVRIVVEAVAAESSIAVGWNKAATTTSGETTGK